MNKKQFLIAIVLASMIGGGISTAAYHFFYGENKKTYININPENSTSFTNYQSSNGSQAPFDFVKAAELTTPAVVHIKTYVDYYASSSQRDAFSKLFEEFYGYRYKRDRSRNDKEEKQERELGSGSGVILTQDGYIVTNNHVIDKAAKIEITLNDKRKYEAELIGTDPTTDLALLKIDAENLDFVNFGNSDELKVGQWVAAVGNPFNLNSTVTAGIVSAKARNIGIINDKENLGIETFIQTDAAVNPGNSGGALVNFNGELVGINSAISSPTGSFAGYSFAVPVEIVSKVVTDLKKYGEVQRALLGVSIQDVTADLAEAQGLKQIKGVYISGVNEGSAASDADIQEGDVILKVNDTEVDNTAQLQGTVARYRPGDKVNVTIARDSKEYEKEIILKNKLGTTNVVKKDAKIILETLGAEVRAIDDKEKEKYALTDGVIITEIKNGTLKDYGLREGFVITRVITDTEVDITSASQLVSIFKNSEGGGALIYGVYPDGRRVRYAVSLQ